MTDRLLSSSSFSRTEPQAFSPGILPEPQYEPLPLERPPPAETPSPVSLDAADMFPVSPYDDQKSVFSTLGEAYEMLVDFANKVPPTVWLLVMLSALAAALYVAYRLLFRSSLFVCKVDCSQEKDKKDKP